MNSDSCTIWCTEGPYFKIQAFWNVIFIQNLRMPIFITVLSSVQILYSHQGITKPASCLQVSYNGGFHDWFLKEHLHQEHMACIGFSYTFSPPFFPSLQWSLSKFNFFVLTCSVDIKTSKLYCWTCHLPTVISEYSVSTEIIVIVRMSV